MSNSAFIPASLILDDIGVFPSDLFELDGGTSVLDRIGIRDVHITETETQTTAYFVIVFADELSVSLPGLTGLSFVFGGNGEQSEFTFEVDLRDEVEVRLVNVSLALRFASNLLQPVKLENGRFVPDTSKQYVEIAVSGTVSVGGEGFRIDGVNELSLAPCMISDSGVVIEASNVVLDLSRDAHIPQTAAAGLPITWMGVFIEEASVHLPPELGTAVPEGLSLKNCFIGSGGFTGKIEASWDPGFGGAIGGVEFLLKTFALDFQQNSLVRSAINGTINLPFFDEPLDVELGFSSNGTLTLQISSESGLAELEKPGVLSLELDSIGFEISVGGFVATISGKIKPLLGDLDWPTFDVKKLSIDSDGNVKLDGGWLDLRDQYAIDFHGFQIEITKLGFGKTEDGGSWIGFSGGLKLVDGLSAGASVEGLRITWYDDDREPRVTLNGVGVEFEVPEVLRFKGAVSYRELTVGDETVHRFDGDIELKLLTLGLEIDATLVIGSASGPQGSYTFFAIYLGVELPAGIPLWSTGLALYGLAGLFALQMEPDKQPDEAWYGIGPGEGWYKRPEIGVTDLKQKWVNHLNSLALGAGITIGTVTDNGFTFSGRMLLVIVFPGPILLIEGKANLLKERSKLDEEPIFRALVVLDARAGSFLIGLDAQYKFGSGGEVIEIGGGAEAYFSLSDASLWHLYLGQKEPREKRIRAGIFFDLFEANAYFMLDADALALGAWVGYDKHWSFGPLSVTLEAWIEGNAIISWKPVHFYGDLWLHGKAELSVFGFGLGLSADARFAADVFDPFHLLAEFSVGINLPWPLPDFDVSITLEWGPEPDPPPLPLPLKEIAVEHFKVSASWPLPRTTLLLPDYDSNTDGFLEPPSPTVAVQEAAAPPANVPVVPVDCRPHITFGRAVHDDALIGVNPQPVLPNAQPSGWEWIGDPDKNEGPVRVRYGLKEVALHKYAGGVWTSVARKGVTANPVGLPDLFGSWAPIPQLPGGAVTPGSDPPLANVKLWLWSKTPFDYTRHGGRAWDEWFTDRFTDYPCVPIPPEQEICYDFEGLAPTDHFVSPLAHPDEPGLIFSWLAPAVQTVTILPNPVDGWRQALCFPSIVTQPDGQPTKPNALTIDLPQPVKAVRLIAIDVEGVQVTGYNADGKAFGPVYGGQSDNPKVEVSGAGIIRVIVQGYVHTCLVAVCLVIGPDEAEIAQRQEMAQHLLDEMAHWSNEGEVLEPHTTYRLKVVTTLETRDFPYDAGFNTTREQTEFVYFRTEGPPGLTQLSTPIGHPNPDEFDSGLDDLARYVRQTVPATVPAAGEKPPLPRPVYRAYDVGAEFNEDYVDLMYRLARRDLGLYLYDHNNRPVRDAQGRLIVLSNRWGVTEELTLTASEERWITVVNASDCASLDTTIIPHHKTLTSAAEGQVLDPDTVYEARLTPLLLHEAFGELSVGAGATGPAGSLDRWTVLDEGANDGPSHWEVGEAGTPPSRYIIQTTNIWGGTLTPEDPVKPGTLLLRADNPALPGNHPEQPGNWTDYRLSLYVRSEDNDAIGLVFRYRNAANYYRFSMDRQRKYRRLVRVVEGLPTILAEDDFVYQQDQDYLITVEAVGDSLRLYQDGTLVFDLTDASIDHGRIGLYCWGNIGARFSDIRVDDFSQAAPIVYCFKFTTSQFANFFHHLHSFQDETWRVALAADLAALVAAAAPPDTAPSEAEARAYETLAGQVLGPAAGQNPPEVQITRVERNGAALALLVQSPEPIDWKRTGLEVLRADRSAPPPTLPAAVKLTGVTFGATEPNEETVSLLLRQATTLTGYRLAYRRLPGPLAEPTGDPILFVDEFEAGQGGLLFQETFGPNALDHYTIVDEGSYLGPSTWSVSAGQIVQSSNVYGGSVSGAVPDKPGTLALTGSTAWANLRLSATLRSEDDDAIGLVFRYQDSDDYYRFSMDRERSYRRLIKKVNGVVSVLWEDNEGYNQSQSYHLVIETYGSQLLGFLDHVPLFSVQDEDIRQGQIGLYCWANTGAYFETLQVEALETPPLLWQPTFEDVSQVDIIDEAGAIQGPSVWNAVDGVLTQTSNLHVVDNSPHRPGTFALGGSADWGDVQIAVRLRSDDNDAIGLMFRYQDSDNYYRFSMDNQQSYRRLIKNVGGVVMVLWEDATPYTVGQSYELTLRAVGSELRGYLDGVLLFTIYDDELKQGQVGLYCWANTGARFERVLVTDQTRRVGRWTIHDEGTISAPSRWRVGGDALRQTSNIHGGTATAADPAKPGSHAVAGDPTWRDYRLTVRLRSDDNDALGLLFRYLDDDNYYRLSLDAERNYRRLIKKEGGVITVLWEESGGYTVGESFTLTVDAIGARLVGYQGSARLFDLNDSAHAAGQIGLYCWANTGARFERVEVRRPPLEAYAWLRDRFANNDTGGWSFVDEGTASGPSNWSTFEGALRQTSNIHTPSNDRDTLSKQGTQAIAGDPTWTEVIVSARLQSLDNDAIGLLFRYTDVNNYYRFSMDSERGYRRLVKNVGGVFSLLWEDDFAYEVGRPYDLTIIASGSTLRGYLDGLPMFVVEDSDLAAGQIGLYCWGNEDARFAQVRVYPVDLVFADWLLDEPFNFLITNRWTFVDEGDQQGPSQWEVSGGELRQTNNIYGGSTTGSVPDKPGTYALTGDLAWRDYRISVQLRSDDDDALGVMVRYQDSDNYYRFSMDRERSYRRLIKKVNGVVIVLWEDNVPYTLGRAYVLTLECVGERLRGYLDGIPLFTVEDSDLAAGRIGLYCWGNTGARFAEVRVAAPAWTPYYTFGREGRLPAGARVQVLAGNMADAPPEEPGVTRRFMAALDARGQLRLPAEGAELRVEAPGQPNGHARHFLPDSDYSAVTEARVIRKADGTGFFIVVPIVSPAGSQLPSGQYRLKMAYHRDNRIADPSSQVLSEAGNKASEQVTIDIPWHSHQMS